MGRGISHPVPGEFLVKHIGMVIRVKIFVLSGE